MGVLSWILWGLFIGAVARLVVPGRQAIGWARTLVLGVVGALVGGYLSAQVFHFGATDSFSLKTFVVAVGVSALVLVGYERLTRPRRPRRALRR